MSTKGEIDPGVTLQGFMESLNNLVQNPPSSFPLDPDLCNYLMNYFGKFFMENSQVVTSADLTGGTWVSTGVSFPHWKKQLVILDYQFGQQGFHREFRYVVSENGGKLTFDDPLSKLPQVGYNDANDPIYPGMPKLLITATGFRKS